MDQNRNQNNNVNDTGNLSEGATSCSCSVDEQGRPSGNHVTARMKWLKEISIVVMECFYSAETWFTNKRILLADV